MVRLISLLLLLGVLYCVLNTHFNREELTQEIEIIPPSIITVEELPPIRAEKE